MSVCGFSRKLSCEIAVLSNVVTPGPDRRHERNIRCNLIAPFDATGSTLFVACCLQFSSRGVQRHEDKLLRTVDAIAELIWRCPLDNSLLQVLHSFHKTVPFLHDASIFHF
jgi:hypothetical protein